MVLVKGKRGVTAVRRLANPLRDLQVLRVPIRSVINRRSAHSFQSFILTMKCNLLVVMQ